MKRYRGLSTVNQLVRTRYAELSPRVVWEKTLGWCDGQERHVAKLVDKTGEILSTAGYDFETTHLVNVFTTPSHRGRGMASIVIDHVLINFSPTGLRISSVPGENYLPENELIAFYGKWGFRPSNVTRNPIEMVREIAATPMA